MILILCKLKKLKHTFRALLSIQNKENILNFRFKQVTGPQIKKKITVIKCNIINSGPSQGLFIFLFLRNLNENLGALSPKLGAPFPKIRAP